ncbi:hypothetical protein HPB47_017982 [Ixodes persulcatus]|uniref:Uncharacterized protein n=2 Tax=Ixodes persulcatus TaxID=34615 RepID=A0AC60R188_IXOPE|nr:hypothetical protein HPB47_023927 [Ixodes persulcatus]KAG0445237.1 hypothetical protein HPB47_017982 [Ixodes persulcatus]
MEKHQPDHTFKTKNKQELPSVKTERNNWNNHKENEGNRETEQAEPLSRAELADAVRAEDRIDKSQSHGQRRGQRRSSNF